MHMLLTAAGHDLSAHRARCLAGIPAQWFQVRRGEWRGISETPSCSDPATQWFFPPPRLRVSST